MYFDDFAKVSGLLNFGYHAITCCLVFKTMPMPLPHLTWLQNSDFAAILTAYEQPFFQAACQVRSGDLILSVDTPYSFFQTTWLPEQVCCIQQSQVLPSDIVAHAAQTPWRDREFDTLIVAHRTDWQDMNALILLQEWHRITHSQGKLILTTFNPHSLWHFKINDEIPFTHLTAPHKLIEQAEQVGWQLEQCRFLLHLPFFKLTERPYWLCILDKMLSLTVPQSACVYGLVFSKPTARLTPTSAFAHAIPNLATASCLHSSSLINNDDVKIPKQTHQQQH